MVFDIEKLLQKFSQKVLIEDILPIKLGVRGCGLSEVEEDAPFIAEWIKQELNAGEIKMTLVNPFLSSQQKNQIIWRFTSQAEKAINDRLRDQDIIKRLKTEHGIYTRIMIHPVRGNSVVGSFKYYDNSHDHYMLNLMAGVFFFSYGNVPDKIKEIRNLRRKATESLDGGLFATAKSIEYVRREEDILGEMLGIPECCRKKFVQNKRNRDTFLLRFGQIDDAREIGREFYERCEKTVRDTFIEEESTLLISYDQKHAYGETDESKKQKVGKDEILKKYIPTKALKFSVFRQMVQEKRLEEKLGLSFEAPLKDKVMSELQSTDGWKYLIKKVLKEKDGKETIDLDALNDLASENLPPYLFSCFATKVYPCRYDCEEAISMFQRMYNAICSVHPDLGKLYKASILFNMMRI